MPGPLRLSNATPLEVVGMSFGIVVETLCLQLLAFAAFWPDKPMFLIMTAVFLVPALALSPGKSFRQLFFSPFQPMWLLPLAALAIPVLTATGFSPGERLALAVVVGSGFCLLRAVSRLFERSPSDDS
jgi:hypothetical protein